MIYVEAGIVNRLKLIEVSGWLIKPDETEGWLILSKERFETRICTH